MGARTIAGKFQGLSALLAIAFVTSMAHADPASTQSSHKKKSSKTHAHHGSRGSSVTKVASTRSSVGDSTLSPLVAPVPPTPPPDAVVVPMASDRSLEPVDRDRENRDVDTIHHRVALTLNPIPLVVGRYGANIEVMLASHHALVASGFLQTYPSSVMHVLAPQVDMSNLPSPLFGGELGYRLYSGREGPEGFFVGPSLVMMPFAYPHVGSDLRAEMVAFETYGAALDVGAQAVIAGGFTIGGGLGAQYLAYSPPASITPPPGTTVPSYPEPHVLPRVLLAAGWAF